MLEAVGLLSLGLTSLDGCLRHRRCGRTGWMVAVGLVLLAGWIVLCAGSGAALIDGAGRTLLVARRLRRARSLVGRAACVVRDGVCRSPDPLRALPAAGARRCSPWPCRSASCCWPARRRPSLGGRRPRARVRRADPVRTHRVLRHGHPGLIGLALTGVARARRSGGARPTGPTHRASVVDAR